jgi:hypothetical protein
MDKGLLEHVLEGNITEEEAKQLEFSRLSPLEQQQRAEESMMTNPVAQLSSFINALFSPKAHDSIDSIISQNEAKNVAQNIFSPDGSVDTLALMASEYGNDIPQAEAMALAKSLAESDAFEKRKAQSGVNTILNNLVEGLMRTQGEFGTAQPLSPRVMPK